MTNDREKQIHRAFELNRRISPFSIVVMNEKNTSGNFAFSLQTCLAGPYQVVFADWARNNKKHLGDRRIGNGFEWEAVFRTFLLKHSHDRELFVFESEEDTFWACFSDYDKVEPIILGFFQACEKKGTLHHLVLEALEPVIAFDDFNKQIAPFLFIDRINKLPFRSRFCVYFDLTKKSEFKERYQSVFDNWCKEHDRDCAQDGYLWENIFMLFMLQQAIPENLFACSADNGACWIYFDDFEKAKPYLIQFKQVCDDDVALQKLVNTVLTRMNEVKYARIDFVQETGGSGLEPSCRRN